MAADDYSMHGQCVCVCVIQVTDIDWRSAPIFLSFLNSIDRDNH